jgi:hypothetical protein
MIEIGCQLIHISCVRSDSPGSGAGLQLLGRTAPGLASRPGARSLTAPVERHPLTAVRFGVLALLSARQLVRSHFLRETAGVLFAGLAAHSFLPPSSAGSAAFWQANNIVGLTWNDTVTVKFSASTLNPSMTVSEYTPAPSFPSGGGGGTGGRAIQPSITLPSNYELTWNQDFSQPFYASIYNNPAALTSQGPCSANSGAAGSVWRSHHSSTETYNNLGVDHQAFSTDAGYLEISGFQSGGLMLGGELDSVDPSWATPSSIRIPNDPASAGGFEFVDGYIEAVIKEPSTAAHGALWIVGTYTNTSHAEIDITENGLQAPGRVGTAPFHAHDWVFNSSTSTYTDVRVNDATISLPVTSDGFHVFGLWIQPASMPNAQVILYVDRKQVNSFPATADFHKPMSIIFGFSYPYGTTSAPVDTIACKYIRVWIPQ